MARRKKARRRKPKMKIPMATVGGLIGLLSTKGASNKSIIMAIQSGNINDIVYEMREKLTGIDANGVFQPAWLVESYSPVIVGALISKFVGGSPLNLNQKLKDVPFIKI